jgi:hypothetical protein
MLSVAAGRGLHVMLMLPSSPFSESPQQRHVFDRLAHAHHSVGAAAASGV